MTAGKKKSTAKAKSGTADTKKVKAAKSPSRQAAGEAAKGKTASRQTAASKAAKAGTKPASTRATRKAVERKEARQDVGVAQPAPERPVRKSRQRVPKAGVPGADGSNPFRASMRRSRAPEARRRAGVGAVSIRWRARAHGVL